MMNVLQARSFTRVAGLWKSSEVLTRRQGCVCCLKSSLISASLTRSLFVCSRSLPLSQGAALSSISGSCVGGPLVAPDILTPRFSCVTITRGKGKKAGKKKYSQKQEEDDDTDDEDDEDMTLESGTDFRELKVRVPSLRMDALLKAGLNMSRNKVESTFYASKIRINGKKILKKSHQCHMGDEIDIIKTVSRRNADFVYVSRIVVVALGDMDDESDTVVVKLRRYPNLLVDCYQDYKEPEQDD